jgi:hypothetical protein
MKKIIYFLLILLVINSCDKLPWSKSKAKDNFIDTYKEILFTREMYPDTMIANPKIKQIIDKHGYTMRSFQESYFNYASDQEEFLKMLDTARARATRDYIQWKNKTKKK